MPYHTPTRRTPFANVWCRQCGHASRFGQWVPTYDHCPYCHAPGSQRYPWSVLRLFHPTLPLNPEIGQSYQLGGVK